jgi:hypothetical protein
MPFVNHDDYQTLLAAQQEAARLAQENARLQHNLELNAPVGRIALGIQREIQSADSQAFALEQAETMAYATVCDEEKQALTRELADELRQTRREEFTERMRLEHGPALRTTLDAQFTRDGTYAQVESDARKEVEGAIRGVLITQKRAEVEAELDTPESRAAIEQEIREELEGSTEMDEYRSDVRSARQDTWRAEVRASVTATIDAGEEAGEADFKERYEVEVRKSDATRRRRQSVRSNLEQTWREATDEKVAKALGDEELQALLTEKAEQAKEKLRRENHARELIADFEGLGIDVTQAEENTKIVVYLGSRGPVKVTEKDRYGDKSTVEKQGVICKRKLTFTSLGAGRFLTEGDSLLNSESVYERNDCLQPGTIVVLGRKVRENGTEKLDYRLAADVPFFYDDDTTTPNIVDTMLGIADVEINGISARDIKYVSMQ